MAKFANNEEKTAWVNSAKILAGQALFGLDRLTEPARVLTIRNAPDALLTSPYQEIFEL
jgi:hypothetical protein